MAKIDENQEAIARIRLAVDDYDRECRERHEQPSADELPDDSESLASLPSQKATAEGPHEKSWSFGGRQPIRTALDVEESTKSNPVYRDFSRRLHSFLLEHLKDEAALESAQYFKVFSRSVHYK